MPPLPSPRTAPDNGPRHAARKPVRTGSGDALTATTGGFPHVQVLEGETANGRHRRPESLADPTVLRPPGADRVPGGRRTSLDLTPRSGKTSRSAKPARSAKSARSAQPARSVESALPGSAEPSPGAKPGAELGGNRRAAVAARGRHAKAGDPLAITVRPLPVVRDAAGAVRDWALADSGRPPVSGSHRAPGTLPIESWLLIGRRRQQALLAALVAVGLMLIVLPMQQRDSGVTPINAADHAIVTATKAPKKKPAPKQDANTGRPAADKPAASAPAQPPAKPAAPGKPAPSASASTPVILVPEGAGPARSFTTTGSTAVALTFDDGPDPEQTPKILALLAKYQVKATFCLVGAQVVKHPELVRQIAAAGHTLCNHTWDHSLTIGKDKPSQIRDDLRRTNEAIQAAVPGVRIPFFRAPGGNFTDKLVQTAYADGMTSLYWEVDPRDWEHLDGEDDAGHVDKIVHTVQKHARAGSIVLSHDFNQPDTVLAYEKLLPWLIDKFELGLPEVPATPKAAAGPASGAL